jgi:2-iminobutanoate/2-iminopropanoate deaminase
MRTTAAGVPIDDDHPYSLVRTADGRTGWVSGVLPYGPDGRLVTERDTAIEAALDVLATRLADAGARLDDVVKVTVYLTDLGWRDALNAAFVRRFRPPFPARTAIEVRRLPRDAPIELDAVVQAGAA